MAASFPSDLAAHVQQQLLARKHTPPSNKTLTKLFETLYFASLRREEMQPISCRVAFLDRRHPDPDPPKRVVPERWRFFPLENDLPLTVESR
jgi:hypothetical protein